MKKYLFDMYQIITDSVMHIPVAYIRKVYLKVVCKSVGKGCQFARHLHIISPHKIIFGDNVFVNRNVTLDGRNELEIKDNVDIGEFSSVWTMQHDIDDEHHSTIGGKTIIEDHVWIAPHCILLPNITIKKGGVIGTNSIVTKSTDSLFLYAGSPAKKIRERKNNCLYTLNYKIYF